LLTIFGSGFAAGRLTAPRPPAFAGPAGTLYTVEDVLTRFTRELRLTAEQRKQIRPIVEQTVQRMSRLPVRSPERLRVYEDCMAQLRPVLQSEQQPGVDWLLERARRTFAQD
jgi:Spy/CpxP family protein refolding chaperone